MERRTMYMNVLQDELSIISGAWASHPLRKKDIVHHLVLGSQGRDSEPHGLALAHYDITLDRLFEPKFTLPTDGGLRPLKIAVHPRGGGVIVSFQTGCKLFDWAEPSEATIKPLNEVELKLEASETVLGALEDAGPQNCLVFNFNGSILATGGQDGSIRVFRWPNMELVLNLPQAFKSIKDLDISLDSAFISATADGSPCRIWDISSSENVATLLPTAGETFGFSRFSRHEKKPFLFVTLTKEKGGYVGVWDFHWNRIGVKKFLREPITAFAITHHGKRLALGSKGGDLSIIEIDKMQPQQNIKKAHSRGVTSLEFSLDNKVLLSISSDCSSRVTALDLSKEWKEWQVILVLLFMMLVSAVYYFGYFAHGDFQVPAGQDQGDSVPVHRSHGEL